MYIEFVDYHIKLSNGETINIAELDLNRVDDLYIREYFSVKRKIVQWIPFIPRKIIEEAKTGYDSNFKKYLGSPPQAVLNRIDNTKCNERYFCASYRPDLCTLKPSIQKREGDYPRCWLYESIMKSERLILSSLIFKMKEGFHIIIVSD